MAVSFEIRIFDLCPKFLANTLVILIAFQATGAVTAGPLQTFPDRFHDLFVFIQPYSHLESHLSALIIEERKKTVNTALFFAALCGILIPLDLEGKDYGTERHLR